VGLILVLMMAGVAGCSGHPTPALTADACGLAGPELIARLAPGTGTPRSTTTPHGTFMFQSDCTTSGPAFETNDLRFRITRYGDCEEGEEGAVWCGSGVDKNRENYDLQCAGKTKNQATQGAYSEPAGLGDRSCLALSVHSSEINAELLVMSGADQIDVDFSTYDKRLTPEATSAGAQEVARTLVAALV
jgi:hypothetical protein